MEWDLLRVGVSWGASTDAAWEMETKDTFKQEPLRYKLKGQKFQIVDSLCKQTALLRYLHASSLGCKDLLIDRVTI